MPGIAVASFLNETVVRAVVNRQHEMDSTVAPEGVSGDKLGVILRLGIGGAMPNVVVAGGDGLSRVYAVERNAEGVSLIQQNKEKFGIENLTVVEGEAPDALKDLPDCDVAIIGGSGNRLSDIVSGGTTSSPEAKTEVGKRLTKSAETRMNAMIRFFVSFN